MAFNVFVFKKYLALLLCGIIPSMMMAGGFIFYGVFWGLGFLAAGLGLGIVIALIMLNSPFTTMLEGKGILAIDFTSTGILRFFLVRVLNAPKVGVDIVGKVAGREVNDVYDRSAVFNMVPPVKGESVAVRNSDGSINFTLSEGDYNKSRFGFLHYPVILYNSQVGSVITKDFLSDQEKDTFANHGILFLNRKMEELTALMRDFARYVVEQLRPKTSLFGNMWVWIIIGVLVVVMLVLFGPSLLEAFKGAAGSAGPAVTGAGKALQSTSPISPV